MSNVKNSSNFYTDIKILLADARNKVYQTINKTMTETYWQIGQRIVEEEQNSKERADYGKGLIKNLSSELTKEFGKGFSVDNLENMRKFYLVFSKSETASRKFRLSWSHYMSQLKASSSKKSREAIPIQGEPLRLIDSIMTDIDLKRGKI